MCCTKEGIIIFIKFYNYAQDATHDKVIYNVMNLIRHKIMIFIML